MHKISGVTISQVLGCGNQHGWTEYYRSSEVLMNVLPKIELKFVLEDERVEEIIELIIQVTRTGEVGDGKIFVTDLEDCIRIRTGERGNKAI
ncbi:MAG: P-II family nitrogen regulator [Cellulosilyticaceae bacterium]